MLLKATKVQNPGASESGQRKYHASVQWLLLATYFVIASPQNNGSKHHKEAVNMNLVCLPLNKIPFYDFLKIFVMELLHSCLLCILTLC
mmetsp:Transcript_47473/g.69438  ORF Transcript_47473/g.69438 Transcript_47473/m.69438 type:complete len:89 (-) Transcript_47473:5-271(-)